MDVVYCSFTGYSYGLFERNKIKLVVVIGLRSRGLNITEKDENPKVFVYVEVKISSYLLTDRIGHEPGRMILLLLFSPV